MRKFSSCFPLTLKVDQLARIGVHRDDVGRNLEDQGVDSFHQSFTQPCDTLGAEALQLLGR